MKPVLSCSALGLSAAGCPGNHPLRGCPGQGRDHCYNGTSQIAGEAETQNWFPKRDKGLDVALRLIQGWRSRDAC